MSAESQRKLEFGGIPGNLAMIFGLPVFTAYLYFAVRFKANREVDYIIPAGEVEIPLGSL